MYSLNRKIKKLLQCIDTKTLFFVLIVGVFVVLIYNTFQLQIIKGRQNLLVATNIVQSKKNVVAPRGIIFDESGKILANNVPSFSVYVKLSELDTKKECDTIHKIESLINTEKDSLYIMFKEKAYKDNSRRKDINKIVLKSNLSFDQYFSILSNINDFEGVYVSVEPIRNYNDSFIYSNIIGYTSDPNENDIKSGINSESQVGKIGIEKQYDEVLRGKDGVVVIETMTSKNSVETENIKPISGNNIYLSINSDWQRYLQGFLKEQIDQNGLDASGAAGVIMNSTTGAVKALVTYPSYDNNKFAVGISSKDYSELINDVKKPLFNRPISLQLPPGSVMKIFGASTALEYGVIDKNTKILSNRCIELPGKIQLCEADKSYLGYVNVEEALEKSSNIFFCEVMKKIHSSVGYQKYYDLTSEFGIGRKTGIDIDGEVSGLLPSEKYKRELFKTPWYIGDECNTVIGQGYVTVTPLQMTVALSAIVNGGNVMEPHLLNKIVDNDGNITFVQEPKVIRNLNMKESTLNTVKSGLRKVVLSGTAKSLNQLPGEIIAKTGSSDAGEFINGKYYSGAHSWLIGCFKHNNEEYCFTVMLQWGGRGYKVIPVMKKFINCLYNSFDNGCENIN